MIIISETLNENFNLPTALNDYFSKCRVGILDIETTGLSPSRHQVILGGLLVFERDGKATIRQYFAERLEDEKDLLYSYLGEIDKCDLLITYNGKSFDMNFLEIRESNLGFPPSQFPYNLDLYLVIRKASDLRSKLPNLRQKTIENYLGLGDQRSDTINGLESIELYGDYIKTGNEKARDKIHLHNRDDLYQLYKLLDVVDLCDMEKAFHHLGFPGTPNLQVTQTKRGPLYLEIRGIQRHNSINYYSFGDFGQSLQIAFDKVSKTFQIMVPIFHRQGSYYLDLESLVLGENSLTQDTSYESGFLIVEERGKLNYKILNDFTRLLVKKIGKETEGK